MTPERWQQINELYHRALELAPERQATFLREMCAGDAALRDEVESLITSHHHAGAFIAEPAIRVAARVLADGRAASLIGRTLSHYRIESLIDTGGMGEVYLAEDTRLDRKVAVKLLNEHLGGDESSFDRFFQEAKAASALNHPNILVIHEIGVSDEAHYIVSEFVDGKTLRAILGERPLTLSEMLDVSIQIASALCTAHEAHLIHLDIKPDNIMIRPDGYLKILDFGLAKLIEQRQVALPGFHLGEATPKLILGTANYMSPEQAKGEPADERTDLFSLGVVMHEMLAGRTPFAGRSTAETVSNLINAQPQPLPRSDELSDEFARIIGKALRKSRDERYPTAKELLGDLKELKERLTAGRRKPAGAYALAALLLAAAGIGAYIWYGTTPPLKADGNTSIAVLPLEPVELENRNRFYEIGIADSLIHKLGSMGLTVRPTSAIARYAGLQQDPLAAAREQKVDFVLASSYRLAGGKVRITARLFDVSTGRLEETYEIREKDAANVFALQEAVASEVGDALAGRFAATSTGRAAQHGTTNEEAYRLYLQGMYLIGKRTPADAREAIAALDESVRLDPKYAQAWAGKAQAHLADFSGDPQGQYRHSMEAVNKALALDGRLADAHSVLCWNKLAYEWDFAGAERECERAVALGPNSSLAHLNYSHYLLSQRRLDAAIAAVKVAIDLEPASLASQRHYGVCLYYARRYREAVIQLKRVEAMDKGFAAPYNWLVVASEMEGEYGEAFEWLMKMKTVYKVPAEEMQAYRTAYQTSGWPGLLRERARRRDALSFRIERGSLYFQGAVEQAKVGDRDKAFAYLEKSFGAREYWMTRLELEPGLDALRDDPRFGELVTRVGLR